MRGLHALLLSLALVAGPALPPTPLAGSDGKTWVLPRVAAEHRFTVLVFFTPTCPVMRAHDERVRALARKYLEQSVQVLMVNSEAEATVEGATRDAAERKYPFPILVDADGVVARALGVRFATTAVVLDASGNVRYRGGLDGERLHVGDETPFTLALALDALLTGHEPEQAETKALGCLLRFK